MLWLCTVLKLSESELSSFAFNTGKVRQLEHSPNMAFNRNMSTSWLLILIQWRICFSYSLQQQSLASKKSFWSYYIVFEKISFFSSCCIQICCYYFDAISFSQLIGNGTGEWWKCHSQSGTSLPRNLLFLSGLMHSVEISALYGYFHCFWTYNLITDFPFFSLFKEWKWKWEW